VSDSRVEHTSSAKTTADEQAAPGTEPVQAPVVREKGSHGTAHIKIIPVNRENRLRIREEAERRMLDFDRSAPPGKPALMAMAQGLLSSLGLDPVGYLGFTMVALSNVFWMDQVKAVDFSRRVVLLPHCLRDSSACPADYDEEGLDCRSCGACALAGLKRTAEELGYQVRIAEGTPVVMRIIVNGEADAIVGVACLDMLEKAIDKILAVGIPAVAVPLLSSNCKDSTVDEDWVRGLLLMKAGPASVRTRTYIPLMRKANAVFEEESLERLAPRTRATAAPAGSRQGDPQSSWDPVASTEALGYEFLVSGGKRFRPFITLAAYDAVTDGNGTAPEAIETGLNVPDHVLQTALAIEVFHKASLVHDDIEDNDLYRYGKKTLHRQHGIPVAINVGDYLIGLGYRVATGAAGQADAGCVAEILQLLAKAHVKLTEGQGAELAWRLSADKSFTPLDALRIYALKTAPAFEAALFAGLRLGGSIDLPDDLLPDFSRNLGVAYQILNDLKDWDGDDDDKLLSGADVLSARPTLLLALTLQSSELEARESLLELLHSGESAERKIEQARHLYRRHGVFGKAERLVTKHRARAEAAADRAEPGRVRGLLYFLADTILQRDKPDNRDLVQTMA